MIGFHISSKKIMKFINIFYNFLGEKSNQNWNLEELKCFFIF